MPVFSVTHEAGTGGLKFWPTLSKTSMTVCLKNKLGMVMHSCKYSYMEGELRMITLHILAWENARPLI
jgi:hypothetical protein